MRRLLLLVALLPIQALAQQCANGEGAVAVCLWIGSLKPDSSGEYRFAYEKRIMDAACVSRFDDEAARNRKVRHLWAQYEDKLVCNSPRFDVQNGSMLKYAVSSRDEDFLFDAACVWKVDLNRIDPSDGRTVLDYAFDEYLRNEDKAIGRKIKGYYDFLRFGCDGGRKRILARHRDELCATGAAKPEGCKYPPPGPACGAPNLPEKRVIACDGYDYYKAIGTTYATYQMHRQQLLERWMKGDMD